MTSQTENSTDCTRDEWIPYKRDEWIPYNPPQPYVQAIGRQEEYTVLRDESMARELARLRSYIEAVERINNREINILYRLIEERTLVLSDVDEIYNDYC